MDFGIDRIQDVEAMSYNGHYVINATLEGIVLKVGEFAARMTSAHDWLGASKLDLHL